MKNLYLFVVLLGALQGCAGIAQPVANVSLVEEKSISNNIDDGVVPETAWNSLENSVVGSKLTLKDQAARLGKLFSAANGKKCRQFYFEQDLVRIVCQDKNSAQWRFVRPVISEYVEISEQEAN